MDSAMKRLMIVSDWTHGLLVGDVGQERYELSRPENERLLQRLVARYDVFMFGWWSAPVRDRLRAIARQQGKSIEIYKYVDPTGWRPSDWEGYMCLIPSARQVISADGRKCLKPEWCLRDRSGKPLRASVIEESGFLVDPTGPGLLQAAKSHVLSLAKDYDGIFLDLLSPTYYNEVALKSGPGDYRWPLRDWEAVPGYAESKLALHSELADHLARNGKKCMHNTTNNWHKGVFWPEFVAGANKTNITFIENFGSTWEGQPVTRSTPGYSKWLDPTLEYMAKCVSQGREAAFQFLSNDADKIRYGYSLFHQAAGSGSMFSGLSLNSQQLYSIEPTEIADYNINLGAPIGPSVGTGLLTRRFERGLSVVNTTSTAITAPLGGAYSTSTDMTEMAIREFAPVSGAMMPGTAFNTSAAPPEFKGALRLGAGGWEKFSQR